jgi:hypothetical protein
MEKLSLDQLPSVPKIGAERAEKMGLWRAQAAARYVREKGKLDEAVLEIVEDKKVNDVAYDAEVLCTMLGPVEAELEPVQFVKHEFIGLGLPFSATAE